MDRTTTIVLIVTVAIVLVVGAVVWSTALRPIETGLPPMRPPNTGGQGIVAGLLAGL